jgi:tetratricopeptide (TPR) repeat protein
VLLERARRLTPGPGWRRGVEAAERHLEAGDAERANALLEAVLDDVPAGRDRAYALSRLGWVRAHRDGFRAAAEVFRAALAEEVGDVALTIEIEEGLSWCTHSVESVPAAQEHARRALALAETLGEPTLLAHALSHVAFLDSLSGGGMAMDTIERALSLPGEPGWTQILGRPDWIHALLLVWDGRLPEARDRLAALHAEALERGDEHSLPFVLFQLARVELLLGDWSAARAHSAECAESTAQSGQIGEYAYAAAIEALITAHVGDVPAARRHIEEGLVLAEARGVQPAALELLAARGFLELSLGEAEAADAVFDEIRARVERSGLREPALFRYHADAIEAKVILGRHEAARACTTPSTSVGRGCRASRRAAPRSWAPSARAAASSPSSVRGRCSCSVRASVATGSGGPRGRRSARRSRSSSGLGPRCGRTRRGPSSAGSGGGRPRTG